MSRVIHPPLQDVQNTVQTAYKIGICPGENLSYIQIYLISSYSHVCKVDIFSKETLSYSQIYLLSGYLIKGLYCILCCRERNKKNQQSTTKSSQISFAVILGHLFGN